MKIEFQNNTFDKNIGEVTIRSSLIDASSQESLNTAASMTDQDGNDLESSNMFNIDF